MDLPLNLQNGFRTVLSLFFQNGSCEKTPIPCDVDFTKKEMYKLIFDSLEEDHSYKKLQLSKLQGPKLTAIVHREMDLPVFW